jgi:hypothetical protein
MTWLQKTDSLITAVCMHLAKMILNPNFGEPNKVEPFKWNLTSPIRAKSGPLVNCQNNRSMQ